MQSSIPVTRSLPSHEFAQVTAQRSVRASGKMRASAPASLLGLLCSRFECSVHLLEPDLGLVDGATEEGHKQPLKCSAIVKRVAPESNDSSRKLCAPSNRPGTMRCPIQR